MSDQNEHGDHRDGNCDGPDTRFLDFEIDKVMYDEAESLVRKAYRELLEDAIKARLQASWGERITALANLAVDEFVADVDANLEIQRLITARNTAHEQVTAKVKAIIDGDDDGNGDGDGDDGDGATA